MFDDFAELNDPDKWKHWTYPKMHYTNFVNELKGEGPMYKQTEKWYKKLYPYSTLGYWLGFHKKKQNMAHAVRRFRGRSNARKYRTPYRRTLYRAKPKVKVYRRRFTRSRTYRRRR